MELDTLKIALLAACGTEDGLVHHLHGELEHWLDRPLASTEIEAALSELVGHGFLTVRPPTEAFEGRREAVQTAYLTTEAGRVLVSERWEEFFPE
jgi:hypothetical protein